MGTTVQVSVRYTSARNVEIGDIVCETDGELSKICKIGVTTDGRAYVFMLQNETDYRMEPKEVKVCIGRSVRIVKQ